MRPLDPLAVPLDGVRLIEASAGTGKTWTIAGLYLRLLLERGLEVPEVLVVTFTNAATEELRDRIRKRVREALAVAQGRADGDDLLRALLARVGEGEVTRQRLADALARMDELAVFTIHGFCQRVLQDNAFESGTLYDAELVTDEQALRREIVEDFWRRRLYDASPADLAWALAEWPDPGALLAEVGSLVGAGEVRLLPEADGGEAERDLATAFEALRRNWTAGRGAVEGLLTGNPALHGGWYAAEKVAAALAAADALCSNETPPAELPDAKALELLTADKIARSTGKGKAPPLHPFFDLCARVLAAHPRARQARRVSLLREAAGYLRAELDARKAARRVLFFDDLLGHLDRALTGPGGAALAERLRRQYPAALIDEFQDTDPVQYRIFRRIYADQAGGALYLIGDPKQAIYGFRGADVFTYMQAVRELDPGAARFTLATNWRSSGPFVEAVNTLFGRVPRAFLIDEIPYVAVAPAGRADAAPLLIDGQAPVPLLMWRLRRPPAE